MGLLFYIFIFDDCWFMLLYKIINRLNHKYNHSKTIIIEELFLGLHKHSFDSRCYDFYRAGIIPNPAENQCLHLLASNGSNIECCYSNIIPSGDDTECPSNTLGVGRHCYTVNKQIQQALNDTAQNSERACHENGGNLVQFTDTREIDIMTDMLMSHPKDSFTLIKYPFLTGLFTNPHFPFSSTSSGKIQKHVTVDPRYMNESIKDAGECTVMDHVTSFESYSSQNPMSKLETSDPENTTYPRYWKPKHGMDLQTIHCSKTAYSVCDHQNPLLPQVYAISATMLMSQNMKSKIEGFYVHPMNSLSACMAYCVSKNQIATIIISGTTCICVEGIIRKLM
jgi:hypothetical protein